MLVYRTEDVVYRNLEWNAKAPGFVIAGALRAQGATGAKRPRNGKSEAISILTIVCVSSGYASGPGV